MPAGVSNAGFARHVRSLQRFPGSDTVVAPPPGIRLIGFTTDEQAINGPLAPGSVHQDGALTITQHDALHAEITYGESWVRLSAGPGDAYAFSVGPPIAPPPTPGHGEGPLFSIPDPDGAPPPLPQRLIRVTSTALITEQHVDAAARVPPLAVQTRITGPETVAEQGADAGSVFPDVIEWTDDDHAQLQLEDSMIRIEAAADAAAVAGDAARARFAYWIDPEWTGSMGDEKRVVIVAAPGVSVRTGSPGHAPLIRYGRKLVEEVVRVPHPSLVPEQGTRLSVEQFVSMDVVDPEAPAFPGIGPLDPDFSQHTDKVEIATGMAGVAIHHPWSGARLTLRPTDPSIGAAYAWQVLPPLDGHPGEIRAVVGPGVHVSLQEPVPVRLRDPYGSTPTPRRGEASTGEGLKEQAFDLQLVAVDDPARVPAQGTPLNLEYLLRFGRFREPDHHQWLGTDDLPYMLATAGMDLIIGLIPVVGQLYTIGQFAYTMATGHDWWGNEIDEGQQVIMGAGAALSLIPLVGGLGALLRGGAKATVIAQFAARWGISTQELEAVLVRVGSAAQGDDAALVQRAMRAITAGEELAESELPALQRVLAKVGAGQLGLQGMARSAGGQLELALAIGGEAARRENYLANLMSAYRTTGEIPDSLAAPLARAGQFGNADEAEAAIQQALRDLARAEGVAADEATIAAVARKTGEAVRNVQAAALVEMTPQTRTLAVSRPQLVADYERLVDQKLPAVMADVLARQRSTPTRTRLAALRTQFDQLRAQVGDATRLTNAQRDTANDLIREARDLARADFDNVRDAVWRRLRNPRQHPDLAQIEQQLLAAGDVEARGTGALSVKMATAEGVRFEPLNIEHRARLSDNPWLYNDPRNLLVSDAAQNQQYLEALRQQGSIWPSDAVEEFVVRFGLNDQGIDFAPRSR